MIIMKLFTCCVAADQQPSLRPMLQSECCTQPSATSPTRAARKAAQ
jgi:hypothetical protein